MADVYTNTIRAFNKRKIEYVVIGMSGINYYIDDSHQLIMTADFDIFLKPEAKNVLKALKVMRGLDFTLSTGSGPPVTLDKDGVQVLVDRGTTITCTTPYGGAVDLCLDVSGYTYADLSKDARVFRAERTPIRVARLEKLLKMKEIAGRRKDILFLERYRLLLEEKEKPGFTDNPRMGSGRYLVT
jgi:hypothetical protein